MKLLYAYTAEAYAAAGLALPNNYVQTLDRVGGSPFLQFQTSGSTIYLSGGTWLAVNTGYAIIRAQMFDTLLNTKPGEIVTLGFRLLRSASWPSTANIMLSLQGAQLMTWREFSNGIGAKTDVFVEVSIDTTLNKATSYVDGRKAAEVPITSKVNLSNVTVGLLELSSSATLVHMSSMYAAVFEQADGISRLGSWACEDLVQTTSEIPTTRTVLDKPLVVEFTPPAKDTLMIAADVQATNPQLYSALNVEISDGATKSTANVVDILQEYINGSTNAAYNSGRPTATLKPANGTTKISLTLKATVK